ncbi:MAG: hypothetical protein LBS73_01460 [Campylobacteraceae bacterium]|jgi:hypothetical protein|nr:hypothetical protein [Campylobacteraceae bacterium]
MKKVVSLALLSALVLGFSGCEDATDKKARAELKIEKGLDLSTSEYKIYQEQEKEKKKQELLRNIMTCEEDIKYIKAKMQKATELENESPASKRKEIIKDFQKTLTKITGLKRQYENELQQYE